MSLLVNCFSPASKMLKLLFCVKYTHEVSDANCYIREQARLSLVSLAALFWMSRNFPPKETSLGGMLCDIQKRLRGRLDRATIEWFGFWRNCVLFGGEVSPSFHVCYDELQARCVFSVPDNHLLNNKNKIFICMAITVFEIIARAYERNN